MLTILINILFTFVLTDFCLKSFEFLPAKIFHDTGEAQKLLPRPYLRKHTNSRNFCALLVFLLLAMGLSSLNNSGFYLKHGGNISFVEILNMLRYCLIFLACGHILISDYLFQIVPDEHLCILALLGFGSYSLNSFSGFLAGFLPFFVFSIFAYLLTGSVALGFGDVKLMGVLGILVGPFTIIQVYVLAGLSSGIFCAGLLGAKALRKIKKGKDYEELGAFIPLAPFIILAYGFISYVSFLPLPPAL